MTLDTSKTLIDLDPVEIVTSSLETSFSLTASAGCGKTYILVQRVVAMLKNGVPIDRLLLLTFTENAASEMRSRLSLELLKFQNEPWAQQALKLIPYSSIQTLNSFAFELCSTYYLEATVATQPKISDDIIYRNLRNKSFSKFYDKWANDPRTKTFFSASNSLEINRNKWKKISLSIENQLPLKFDETEFDFQEMDTELSRLISKSCGSCLELSFQALENLQDIDVSGLGKAPAKRITSIVKFLEKIASSDNQTDILETIAHRNKFITDASYKNRGKDFDDFEDLFSDIKGIIDNKLPEIIDSVLQFGTKWLIEFSLEFRKLRFEQGAITHDESLQLAAYLLQNESIKFDIWNKYDSILIDEFQDTDNVQISIIEALIENDGQENFGRLFVVGDSKQAIYGFRGAQVRSYEQFVAKSEARLLPLEKSFRSVNGVLITVNTLMHEMLVDYSPMENVRMDYDADNGHVMILGKKCGSNADQVRKTQAVDIAESISSFLGTELRVENGQSRTAKLSDIAVLVRASTGITDLIDACERNSIAYRVDSSDIIWELTFTKMFLAMFNAITNPRDHVSIVAALKSPIFQCDNDDLIAHAVSRHSIYELKTEEQKKAIERSQVIWNYSMQRSSAAKTKVTVAMDQLAALHAEFQKTKPIELVTYLLYERGLLRTFNSVSNTSYDAIARYMQSIAIYFEESSSPSTCFGFSKYLSEIFKTKKSPVKFVSDDSLDAIHIMTIHKSKGLEFPIVYLAPSVTEINKIDPVAFNLSEEYVFTPNEIGLYFNKDIRDSKLDEKLESQLTEKIEEEIRLLYVGMTRARDYLIFCMHDKDDSKTTPKKPEKAASGGVKLLTQALTKTGLIDSLKRLEDRKKSTAQDCTSPASLDAHEILMPSTEKTSLLLESLNVNRVLSPSNIDSDDIGNEPTVGSSSPRIEITKPRKSNLIGTATHRALNLISFDASDDEIESVSKSCAIREGIPDKVQEISDMLKKTLNCELIREAPMCLREVPISGKIGEHFVEGYIDLLVNTPEGWLIVDYKTDAIDTKFSIESKIDKYAPQLAAYAYLLNKIHRMPVARAALLFLRSKDPELVFVEQLNEFKIDLPQ